MKLANRSYSKNSVVHHIKVNNIKCDPLSLEFISYVESQW